MKKPVTKEEENLFAVNCFVFYMANHWCLEESIRVFGKNLGIHFFGKWAVMNECHTPDDASLGLWYAMSDTNRQLLIDAAVSHYRAELDD